jgi:hypothetical protein
VMTGVVGAQLVVFSQVSAVLPCWAVRWPTLRAEPFARILHACSGRKASRNVCKIGGAYSMFAPPSRPRVAPGDRAVAGTGAAARTTHPRQPNRYLSCSPAPRATGPNRYGRHAAGSRTGLVESDHLPMSGCVQNGELA